VFAIGVGGFGVASVLCAAAPTIEVLVGARALQGVFGALLTPASLAILIATFPPSERGAAIGAWTAWAGMAMLVGPVLGGQLVDAASWRWVFAINVPFVVVAVMLSLRYVTERPRTGPRVRVDWLGAVLGALGLAGPVLALIEQPVRGWGDPVVAGGLIGGAVLLIAFVAWQARAPHPMLPLSLFRSRNFAWGNVETLCMYGALGVFGFVLVLFLQQVAGYTALEAGLATLPTTVVMFFLARRFGALADRFGPRPFMGVGPIVGAAGLLYLAMAMDPRLDYVTEVLPGVLLFSLGLSITVAPLTAAILAGASDDQAGIASAVNNAASRIAGLVAVAAVGAIVASRLGAPSFDQATPDDALSAFRLAMTLSAGLLALGGLVGLAMIRDPRKACMEAGVVAEECANMQAMGAPRPDLVHDAEDGLEVVDRRELTGAR
jgi:EmrB/QacA subfamily drug resistance transporter